MYKNVADPVYTDQTVSHNQTQTIQICQFSRARLEVIIEYTEFGLPKAFFKTNKVNKNHSNLNRGSGLIMKNLLSEERQLEDDLFPNHKTDELLTHKVELNDSFKKGDINQENMLSKEKREDNTIREMSPHGVGSYKFTKGESKETTSLRLYPRSTLKSDLSRLDMINFGSSETIKNKIEVSALEKSLNYQQNNSNSINKSKIDHDQRTNKIIHQTKEEAESPEKSFSQKKIANGQFLPKKNNNR